LKQNFTYYLTREIYLQAFDQDLPETSITHWFRTQKFNYLGLQFWQKRLKRLGHLEITSPGMQLLESGSMCGNFALAQVMTVAVSTAAGEIDTKNFRPSTCVFKAGTLIPMLERNLLIAPAHAKITNVAVRDATVHYRIAKFSFDKALQAAKTAQCMYRANFLSMLHKAVLLHHSNLLQLSKY